MNRPRFNVLITERICVKTLNQSRCWCTIVGRSCPYLLTLAVDGFGCFPEHTEASALGNCVRAHIRLMDMHTAHTASCWDVRFVVGAMACFFGVDLDLEAQSFNLHRNSLLLFCYCSPK